MKKLLSLIMTVLLVMPFFVGCADTEEESGEMPFGTEPGEQSEKRTETENAKLINVSYDPKTVRDSSRYTVTNMFNASECDTITIEGFEIDYLAHTTADTSGNTVSAKDGWTKSWLDDLWAVPGDTIEFYDKDYDMLGSAVLVSFDRGDMELDSIPAGVDSTCFAINASCCPITVISDCVVSRGRARAFLLQTKNAAVVGCDISHLRLPAVIISPDFDTWFEGGFADNVILCNNTFADCCRASHTKNYGVILIAGCHDLKPVPKKGVIAHKNITVKDNMFIGCNSNAVYHHGAANVKFVGNLFAGCSGEVRSD